MFALRKRIVYIAVIPENRQHVIAEAGWGGATRKHARRVVAVVGFLLDLPVLLLGGATLFVLALAASVTALAAGVAVAPPYLVARSAMRLLDRRRLERATAHPVELFRCDAAAGAAMARQLAEIRGLPETPDPSVGRTRGDAAGPGRGSRGGAWGPARRQLGPTTGRETE
jgi:hypothetical protein